MSILYNKDGSVFKLRGPNPIMKGQTMWNDFTVHNMKVTGQVVPDAQITETLNSDFNIKDDFTSVLEQTKPEIIETPPPIIEEKKPEKTNLPAGVKKIFTHCLPATLRERRDNIYGSKYQTIQYGKPFACEIVILKEEDLFIEIWTNVSQISRGSIIYPKSGMDAQRWWRIQEKVEKAGGWLLTGSISDYNPTFDQI